MPCCLGISADHCQKGSSIMAASRSIQEPGNAAHERKPEHVLNEVPRCQRQAASSFHQPKILREGGCNAIRKRGMA